MMLMPIITPSSLKIISINVIAVKSWLPPFDSQPFHPGFLGGGTYPFSQLGILFYNCKLQIWPLASLSKISTLHIVCYS